VSQKSGSPHKLACSRPGIKEKGTGRNRGGERHLWNRINRGTPEKTEEIEKNTSTIANYDSHRGKVTEQPKKSLEGTSEREKKKRKQHKEERKDI